nr:hypothetical protein CFP56_44843 [Quercus suber]
MSKIVPESKVLAAPLLGLTDGAEVDERRVKPVLMLMDIDAPPGSGAPGDPHPPNPPELVVPIGLGASLLPLPPKQGGRDPSIVW